MELDSLKEIWRDMAGKDKEAGSSDDQILVMLQKKSQGSIAKMKRNLLCELVIMVVLYSTTIIYYLFAWKGRFWALALMLFIVGVFLLFYYYRKNKLLNSMQCMVCEVRSNLSKQLATLEAYVRFYFIAGTLLTPVAYFLAGLIVLYESGPGIGFSAYSTRFYLIFAGIGIAITVLVYFINIWYVDRLYGQHIKKLKDLLKQIDEPD